MTQLSAGRPQGSRWKLRQGSDTPSTRVRSFPPQHREVLGLSALPASSLSSPVTHLDPFPSPLSPPHLTELEEEGGHHRLTSSSPPSCAGSGKVDVTLLFEVIRCFRLIIQGPMKERVN
ncbi:hypothetical protein E2C01_064584 [Portunus trituberculatus]|uniref:Uncharacterized protein n=1 Tax=Portunus trituberculatus TaxID=210409 RepID=A0A5B7HDE8_PORTR|nr:hypothetical protein [Portunus trituberculatus]